MLLFKLSDYVPKITGKILSIPGVYNALDLGSRDSVKTILEVECKNEEGLNKFRSELLDKPYNPFVNADEIPPVLFNHLESNKNTSEV